jgi:hypothetical protein
MIIVSHRIEHLVSHALFQAGVLITDQDVRLLREDAIRKYWEIHFWQPQLDQKELSKKLIDRIILNRHRGTLSPKESLAQQLEDIDQTAESIALSYQVQLTSLERDVLYLLKVVGVNEAQISEKLGRYDDQVSVTMAKLAQLYGLMG